MERKREDMPGRLLIVEADARFRGSLAEHFRRLGLEVVEAETSAQARRRLAAERPDVVLLSLGRSPGKRLELISEIAGVAGGARVVAMVPAGAVSLSMEAMKHGAYDDIMVPFDRTELAEIVESALTDRADPA